MKTIWKYIISDPISDIRLPQGAQLLTIAEQHGKIALWALVDPQAPSTIRRVQVVGTGHDEVPTPTPPYIGTAHMLNGQLILHAFDLGEPT